MQDKPVGRCPMAGVAIAYCGTRGHGARDCREFRLWLQPVGVRIIEPRAVDIHRTRNMAIGLRGWRLLLAEEERRRPRVDERRATLAFDSLDITGFGQNASVDRCRENLWRWSFGSAFD